MIRYRFTEIISPLKKRDHDADKWCYGRLLLAGGNKGMPGAIRLAAEVSLRIGVGLVSVLTHPDSQLAVQSGRPELMVTPVKAGDGGCICSRLQLASAVVIGPGMGRDGWAVTLLKQLIESSQPMVVDADALNLLVESQRKRENWILTPHIREASRLLECGVEDIKGDREGAIKELAERYGGVIVLKGAATLITAGTGDIYQCLDGNPGMASGGMGDLLSGVIGGLLALGVPALAAARYGVALHASAADHIAQRDGEWGLLASDLIPEIRKLLNQDMR